MGHWAWGSRPSGSSVGLISLYDVENNAVRQLSAALRREGRRTVEIYFKDWRNNRFEAPAPQEIDRLLHLLRREGVGLVGVSLRASAYERVARQIIGTIQARLGLPVIVGGWHATVRPESCIRFADAVCVGEADLAFPRFVRHFFARRRARVLSNPNFWVNTESGIRRNPQLPLIADLDTIPWRDYTSRDKWFIDRGGVRRGDPMARDPLYQVMCSIGCLQRCAFCHNSFEGGAPGPRLRFRSVSSVIAELNARRRTTRIRRVRFDDEVFGLDPTWLDEFASRWPVEVGLPFDILTEPTVVTATYARRLRQAGCEVAHLGIQSTDRVNREKLERRASLETTRTAVEHLVDNGIRIRYLVMVDIEGAGEEAYRSLFEFFQTVPRPYDLYLFSLTYFPGAKLVEDMLADGRLSPQEVEGAAQKTFRQYRVDLGYPRPPRDTWWISLLVLQACNLVPRRVLDLVARRRPFLSAPARMVRLANVATLVKTGWVAATMIRNRELTPTLVRRWWNPRGMITM